MSGRASLVFVDEGKNASIVAKFAFGRSKSGLIHLNANYLNVPMVLPGVIWQAFQGVNVVLDKKERGPPRSGHSQGHGCAEAKWAP